MVRFPLHTERTGYYPRVVNSVLQLLCLTDIKLELFYPVTR